MPRKKINLPYTIEYLSILDEKGKLDEKLEPDIPKEILFNL
ncbi:MAG: pyruvate dehydrogenase (acetyl-transferring) E1 component subunit alpha, partial [Deltaproteobacteria bacterium]|nr:pyruvate dehydrogenase (acetyl-transferring) E1 component subunit alpha [Deltaproteobacteria bacterium]